MRHALAEGSIGTGAHAANEAKSWADACMMCQPHALIDSVSLASPAMLVLPDRRLAELAGMPTKASAAHKC